MGGRHFRSTCAQSLSHAAFNHRACACPWVALGVDSDEDWLLAGLDQAEPG